MAGELLKDCAKRFFFLSSRTPKAFSDYAAKIWFSAVPDENHVYKMKAAEEAKFPKVLALQK